MKLLRHFITMVCIGAAFAANADADEQLTGEGKAKCAVKDAVKQPTAAELKLLQGTWEGFLVGQESTKVTITIKGNSLHFHRDKDFWFETTITLPAGKAPKQLHATIKRCPPSQDSSVGEVVRAFFKIEDGTLTLATIGDDAEETPESFEATKDHGTRYELRKVLPQKKNTEPPKSKETANA